MGNFAAITGTKCDVGDMIGVINASTAEGQANLVSVPVGAQKQLTEFNRFYFLAKVMSTDLSDGMAADTVGGSAVTIGTEGGVMVNDANVVSADIEASNGVIHVIDKVLIPEG